MCESFDEVTPGIYVCVDYDKGMVTSAGLMGRKPQALLVLVCSPRVRLWSVKGHPRRSPGLPIVWIRILLVKRKPAACC